MGSPDAYKDNATAGKLGTRLGCGYQPMHAAQVTAGVKASEVARRVAVP